MAGKQFPGEALPSSVAGLSKTQLYDIVSQMKNLIEQNQEQARQILIQNPLLTRALFQAQIMLGMVQPSQTISNIQPQTSQQPQSSAQQTTAYMSQSLLGSVGPQEKSNITQDPNPVRKQQNQPSATMLSSASKGLHSQSQSMPSVHQPRSQLNAQASSMPLSQSAQVPNISIPPSMAHPSGLQPMPLHQPSMPPRSSQLLPPMQTTGASHLPLQPPLPPQPRPPSMASAHQFQSHMGPNMNFQHPGPPQLHSQPPFHSCMKQQTGMGPPFSHGQPQLPSQPPQSLYQGGPPHLGPMDYNTPGGSSMQMERGSRWASSENTGGLHLPGLPLPPQQQLPPQVQPGLGNQPRPPLISPEMEQALLQQVMSLTPEQINLLPPEQRHQVLQLQQMLR